MFGSLGAEMGLEALSRTRENGRIYKRNLCGLKEAENCGVSFSLPSRHTYRLRGMNWRPDVVILRKNPGESETVEITFPIEANVRIEGKEGLLDKTMLTARVARWCSGLARV